MLRQPYRDHFKEITRKPVIRDGIQPMDNGMQISTTIADTTVGQWLPIMIIMDIILIPTSLITTMMSPRPLSEEPKEIIQAAGIIPIQESNVLSDGLFSRLT